MAESCKTCYYFVLVSGSSGLCHRYPPVFIGESEMELNFNIPRVWDDDWCGEYKPQQF